MAQSDRDILFANESFVIGVFQAVAGASLVAALSQAETLIKYTSRFWFAGFLTAMAIAMLSAVLAAYWKHQYKLWDVKAQASAARLQQDEAKARSDSANTYLSSMRSAMFVAVISIVAGIVELVLAFWVVFARGA